MHRSVSLIVATTAIAGTVAGCGGSDRSSSTAAEKTGSTTARDVVLVVDSPRDFTEVHSSQVKLRGTVDPPNADVDVDGSPARVSGSSWRKTVTGLHRGENELSVNATAGGHDLRTVSVTVIRKRTRAEIVAARRARAIRRQKAEAEFRAGAKHIDYDQLLKNPDRFAGTHAVFSGEILQIREDPGGGGFMLLQTSCDEFDICDDLVYVSYDHSVNSAEDDRLTVYGTITGGKEYDTQGGGSNFVPAVHARYVDE